MTGDIIKTKYPIDQIQEMLRPKKLEIEVLFIH